MADETRYPGTVVTLRAVFRDADGDLFDPDTVTFKIRLTPSGAITTYVYGTDEQLVRDSDGVYRVDWLAAESGDYCWRMEGGGDKAAAAESEFTIAESCFA